MEQKEFNELMTKFKDEARPFVEGIVEAATKNSITTEKMATELERFADKDQIDELKGIVEKQGVEMRKLFEKNETEKTVNDLIAENADAFKELAKDPKGSVQIKVPAGMLMKTDVTRSSVTSHTLAYRLPNVGQMQTRRLTLEQMFPVINVGSNTNGVVRYVDQTTQTRNAAEKAEAAAYAESAAAWTEYSLNLQKITDSIPVTREALNDVNWINGEINNFIRKNILLKEDTQLYSGNGTAPNIKGAYTYATEYTAAAAGITSANIFDLLLKIKENVTNGTMYMPNFVMMNPQDVSTMLLTKASDNQYVRPDFFRMNADGTMNVLGMTIIESPVVTQDTLLVGDFNYGTIYRIDDLTLEFGYVNDDFTKDLITLKGYKRENLLIRSVDAGAFNKETGIAAALVTLAS